MDALIERLNGRRKRGTLDGVQEKVVFPLPKGLNPGSAGVERVRRRESAR